MLPFYLGVVAMGALTGLFIGLSNSPVVATALPLLFALLGSGAGFYALLQGDGLATSRLGIVLLCLAIPIGVVSICAANLRIHGNVWGGGDKFAVSTFTYSSPGRLADLYEVAALMRGIGVNEEAVNLTVAEFLKAEPALRKQMIVEISKAEKILTELLDVSSRVPMPQRILQEDVVVAADGNRKSRGGLVTSPEEMNASRISVLVSLKNQLRMARSALKGHSHPDSLDWAVKTLSNGECRGLSDAFGAERYADKNEAMERLFDACASLQIVVSRHPVTILGSLREKVKNLQESKVFPNIGEKNKSIRLELLSGD